MSESVCSIAFSQRQALGVFKAVTAAKILSAVLAGLPPRPPWEGCTVHLGAPANGDRDLIYVGIAGEAAAEIERNLVEALERLGITVHELTGGQPVGAPLARVIGGRWESL